MAEFTTDELIDCIRNNIVLLNDSGFDNRVLLSPRRFNYYFWSCWVVGWFSNNTGGRHLL